MKLTFLGATGTVTGSKYLLEDDGKKILIDCGLFQGAKELRQRNWEGLPLPPTVIDAVLLTHAHIDHSGYLPKLVKAGFKGPIYCSAATFDLCKILLPDSGHLQEEDTASANRYGYSEHRPALPLYTEQEARDCLSSFKVVDVGKSYRLSENLVFTLQRAGHILGASFIQISDGQTSVLFSGDVGRLNDPVMKPPVQIQEADYLVLESTYGNRLHPRTDPVTEIENIIRKTTARGGTIVIPAFAVGRSQTVMYYLYKLKTEGRLPPSLPIFLDSPMAINASGLLCQYPNEHHLSHGLCGKVCDVAKYITTVEASKALDRDSSNMPKIIISASGMATGGRVLHHLKTFIGDPRNTVLLPGFQASGTRGDRLVRGEKEIKIHGQMWPVRAEIVQMNSLSAHADYEEILQWLSHFRKAPHKVFLTHGEPEAAISLKQKIEETYNWSVLIPEYGQREEI